MYKHIDFVTKLRSPDVASARVEPLKAYTSREKAISKLNSDIAIGTRKSKDAEWSCKVQESSHSRSYQIFPLARKVFIGNVGLTRQ